MALTAKNKKQVQKLKAKAKTATLSAKEQTRLKFLQQKKAKQAAKPKAASKPKIASKPLRQNVKAADAIADKQAKENLRLNNPNMEGPVGGSTYDPETNTYETHLSDDQQKILDTGEQLTQQGQGLAQQNLGGYDQYQADTSGMGNYSFAADDQARQRIEQATFDRLSRGMDTRHKAQSDQLAQDLYNRGIQFSADPNSRYQQEMAAMQQGQQAERQSYEQQAVQMGGREMQRAYDISSGAYGTNLAGNQARNAANLTEQQQMMSDTANLQNMGTGLMMPNLPGFQGTTYDLTGGINAAQQQQQIQQQGKLTNATISNMQRQNSGGGSSSGGGQQQVFY